MVKDICTREKLRLNGSLQPIHYSISNKPIIALSSIKIKPTMIVVRDLLPSTLPLIFELFDLLHLPFMLILGHVIMNKGRENSDAILYKDVGSCKEEQE